MTKIYVADDEPVPIRVVKMTLERDGFDVETVPAVALSDLAVEMDRFIDPVNTGVEVPDPVQDVGV